MDLSELKSRLHDVFDPLANKIGLTRCVEVSLTHTEFSLAYLNDCAGLEVSVDLSDFFIYVQLFRPDRQQIPSAYLDESGRRQKLYMQEALGTLHINVMRETKMLQQLGGNYKNHSEMTTVLAEMLEKYWPIIQENWASLFQPVGRAT